MASTAAKRGAAPSIAPSTCLSSEFECRVKSNCIPTEWKCDGTADCEDGTDEENCGKYCVIHIVKDLIQIGVLYIHTSVPCRLRLG